MADTTLNVAVICGSLRKGSFNAELARTLPGLAPAGLSLTQAPSWAQFPVYNHDDQVATGIPAAVNAWADAIRAADGVIVVSPEYNWGIPGGLKNAIDWGVAPERCAFANKPVAMQSAAPGLLGGARMQAQLRMALTSLDALMFGKPEVFVNLAAKKFDEKTLALIDQPTIDMVKAQLAAFEKFVRRMTGKA